MNSRCIALLAAVVITSGCSPTAPDTLSKGERPALLQIDVSPSCATEGPGALPVRHFEWIVRRVKIQRLTRTVFLLPKKEDPGHLDWLTLEIGGGGGPVRGLLYGYARIDRRQQAPGYLFVEFGTRGASTLIGGAGEEAGSERQGITGTMSADISVGMFPDVLVVGHCYAADHGWSLHEL